MNTILNNTEMEREVLASVMLDNNLYESVKGMLQKELFVDGECRCVYDIIKELDEKGQAPDITEIGIILQQRGGNIVNFMTMETSSYVITQQRIDTLKEYLLKRNITQLCQKGMQIASDPLAEIEDFNNLLSDLTNITASQASNIQSFGEVVPALISDVTERKNETMELGMMTGLNIFDIRKGFHCGDLVVIAGETSQGKSTLATTIARNMAINGIALAYYSMEMSSKQLTARILARDVRISSSRMLFDKLSDGEFNKFYDGSMQMKDLPIFFDERSKTSFEKICTSIRAMVRKNNIRICFIDYLQILANGGRQDNREQLIGDMARELKRIAVEENICVVALSQLSRDPQRHEPVISRLRGSGQIEEACDIIITIYRPEIYGILKYSNGTSTTGTAQIKIAKGRNIGLAEDIVSFNSELTYFSDGQLTKEGTKTEMPW